MHNVLVLGGTGAIGKHLVRWLSKDCIVTVTSRSKHEDEFHVEYIKGNARDNAFLDEILSKRYDAIVDFMRYGTEEFALRVDKLLQNTDHYLFISSARVYSKSVNPIKETSSRLLDVCKDEEYLSTDEYALSKARQENILQSKDLRNWTIIRPYITYSENRLQLGTLEKEEWLFRALSGRKVVFSEDILNKYTTLTYGKDVSEAIAKLTCNEEAKGQVYHITGGVPITWKQALTIYSNAFQEETGRKLEYVLTKESLNLKLGKAAYQVRYDRLYDRVFSEEKIKTIIDTSSFKTPEQGLSDCIKAMIRSGHFNFINWEKEALFDKQSHEFANFSVFPSKKDLLRYYIVRFMPVSLYLLIRRNIY